MICPTLRESNFLQVSIPVYLQTDHHHWANFPSVQANDDMFFLSSLSTSDFYSPLYGTVIRLDSALMVRPIRPVIKADGGEWAGLQHASWLLSAFALHRAARLGALEADAAISSQVNDTQTVHATTSYTRRKHSVYRCYKR